MATKTTIDSTNHLNLGAHLILLGTHAGPPIYSDRFGISSVLIVDGNCYVIDCGRGSVSQYVKAGLRFDKLRAVFITHQHADHLADYFNFLMLPAIANTNAGDRLVGLDVYGPGPAGGIPNNRDGRQITDGQTLPGIAGLTRHMYEAYAYSSSIFRVESGAHNYADLVSVSEIMPPSTAGASWQNTSPLTWPFPVMEDSNIQVAATLVPHGPVFPALAFRIDTKYGSFTFSGDTAPSENLIRLAKNTDVLIHEAVNVESSDLPEKFAHHMLTTHTAVQEVGKIAEKAGAHHLVLSHIADTAHEPINTQLWLRWAQHGYAGKTDIGRDLDVYSLPQSHHYSRHNLKEELP